MPALAVDGYLRELAGMAEGKISVLVTDLDNTLFDWVDIWYNSFSAMLEKTIEITGLSLDTLLAEIKQVHQRHGTSEYAFLLTELPCLRYTLGEKGILRTLAPAIAAFRNARDAHLHLYPGVDATLRSLKALGVILVGYTESMEPYTVFRMQHLGLDGMLDILFTPKGHDIPADLDPEWFEHHRFFQCKLRHTDRRHTPEGHFKPDPVILLSILQELDIQPSRTAYVGDSLMKDVAMAQLAGVHDAHARYGAAQNRSEYDLLRAVTHWTVEDVERERRILVAGVTPTHVLERGFDDLLRCFQFEGTL
jgi:phosphoglycolate phosphatase-like HAD superfamily hydrolase